MKKKVLSMFLALCMMTTLVTPAFATDGTKDVPNTPPQAPTEDTTTAGDTADTMSVQELQSALDAAKNAPDNKVVKLTSDVTIEAKDLEGVRTDGTAAVINVPDGVTLDGDRHSIIASEWSEDQKTKIHVIGVLDAKTDTTIQNLTIEGNKNPRAGINIYDCSGNVALNDVTINNCGAVGVQVNGSKVTATNLTTEGNAWGGVNVDQGSATATPSFELVSGTLNEPAKIYTELTGEENANVIKVPEAWGTVEGDMNVFAPKDELAKDVVYNETTKTYYQTLALAIEKANADDVIDLQGKVCNENVKIDKKLTLKNGSVNAVSAIGDIDGLTFDGITFLGASTENNFDTTPSALYLQGLNKMTNVVVKDCMFKGPQLDTTTIAITTLNVENLIVQDSTIDGYTISAYHNPGNGGNITYKDNTIKNVKSGLAFIVTNGVTVTGNTFENANGVRVEPSYNQNDAKSSNITISGNKFLSVSSDSTYGQYAVRTQSSDGVSGVAKDETVTLKNNYWGSADPDFSKLIVSPEGQKIVTEPYYKAETMRDEDLSNYEPPYTGKYSYEITTKVGDNGSIKVDRYATEDEKVTITVTPDEAYLLDELTATSGKKEIELKDNGDGTYTFTMPHGNVTITATFAEDPDWEKPTPEPEMPFTDVNDGDWFYDVVKYAYNEGLMTGTSETTFEPNIATTRGMIVSMLARLEGNPTAKSAGFADVADGAWYADAVNWAASEGIVSGYSDTKFGPNDPITREQMAAILYNYAEYKGMDVSARASFDKYTDASSISSWATDVMQWAVSEELISGVTTDTLIPQGNATRAQVAAIFERFLTK